MAVAQTTIMNTLAGGTPAANGTLVLSTAEQEWLFVSTIRDFTVLQLISDAAWLLATQASGPYTLVPANAATKLPVKTGAGQSVFVKSVAATPTLYSSTAG